MISASASSFTPPRFTFNGNTPEFHPAPSIKTVWQHSVVQADLPFHTKGILLIVATEWMNADGGSCFPTEEQIMAKAGISRPCLTRHLRIAVDNGFIERWRWGHGNGNRRYNYRAIIPGQPAPTVEMGNVVSYPTGEMGNVVSQHKPCPIDNQFQKPESAATPEPARPEPAPQPQAAHSGSLRTAKTEAPDALPDAWIEQAGLMRPDLTADQIRASAEVFIDNHRAKGTLLVDWLPAWRNWIRRERAPKAPQTATAATQPANRYARLDAKEQPLSAAVRAALEVGEQNRIAMLIQNGIDPTTGTTMNTPTEPATAPASKIKPVFTPASKPRLEAEKMRRIAELASRGLSLAEARAMVDREGKG